MGTPPPRAVDDGVLVEEAVNGAVNGTGGLQAYGRWRKRSWADRTDVPGWRISRVSLGSRWPFTECVGLCPGRLRAGTQRQAVILTRNEWLPRGAAYVPLGLAHGKRSAYCVP